MNKKNLFSNSIAVLIVLIVILSATATSYIDVKSSIKKTEVKEWTLMFYCSGDDKLWFGDGNNTFLKNESVLKIQDMFMKLPIFSKLKINVVVLIDAATVIYGYYSPSRIKSINKFNLIEEYDEMNFGNYTTLRDFIIKCKSDFPANRYFLYGFGHGGGWRGAFSDDYINETGKTFDQITMEEIRLALEESGGVDIILLSNCIMACLESAYELRNCTDVYISSQEITIQLLLPATSWYNCINVLKKTPYLSSYDIADEVIKNYKKIYRNPLSIMQERNRLFFNDPKVFTMSAIRTDKINNLCLAVDDLSELYINNPSKYESYITDARSKTDDFPSTLLHSEPINGFLIDIYHFADLLSKDALNNDECNLYDAAEDVKKCLNNVVFSEWHQIDHPNANGLCLFFSEGNISENPGPLANYDHDSYVNAALYFKDDHLWDEFLELYLN